MAVSSRPGLLRALCLCCVAIESIEAVSMALAEVWAE
jgi:hypothetical protein